MAINYDVHSQTPLIAFVPITICKEHTMGKLFFTLKSCAFRILKPFNQQTIPSNDLKSKLISWSNG